MANVFHLKLLLLAASLTASTLLATRTTGRVDPAQNHPSRVETEQTLQQITQFVSTAEPFAQQGAWLSLYTLVCQYSEMLYDRLATNVFGGASSDQWFRIGSLVSRLHILRQDMAIQLQLDPA